MIDRLVLTHRDADHTGGAAALLAGIAVGELLDSMEPGHPLHALAAVRRRCESGQQWAWDGVRFRVLHPLATDYAFAQRPNALSCVIQVEDAEGRRALITGDIERPQEAALVEREGDGLRSAVLIAPHHGSRTSSTAPFLAAVAPVQVVVQAGYLNRFGHPAADVVERYREAGAELVRSDRCGAWQWQSGRSWCIRATRPRYWRWNVPPAGARENTEAGAADGGAEVAKLVTLGGMK